MRSANLSVSINERGQIDADNDCNRADNCWWKYFIYSLYSCKFNYKSKDTVDGKNNKSAEKYH